MDPKKDSFSIQTKQDPSLCCLQQRHFKYKETNRLKLEAGTKAYHVKPKELEQLRAYQSK